MESNGGGGGSQWLGLPGRQRASRTLSSVTVPAPSGRRTLVRFEYHGLRKSVKGWSGNGPPDRDHTQKGRVVGEPVFLISPPASSRSYTRDIRWRTRAHDSYPGCNLQSAVRDFQNRPHLSARGTGGRESRQSGKRRPASTMAEARQCSAGSHVMNSVDFARLGFRTARHSRFGAGESRPCSCFP